MRVLVTTRPAGGHLRPLLPFGHGPRDRYDDDELAVSAPFVVDVLTAGFPGHPVGSPWTTAEMPERFPAVGAPPARARRYAYHFFFNRMIPLPFVKPKAGYPIYTLELDRLDRLLPGQSAGLDTICDGILGKGPFVLRDRSARPPALTTS